MSFNRPQQIDYTQRYKILSGRVNYANYVQRNQLVNEGRILGINLYFPDNDVSALTLINEGIVATTPEEVARYLQDVSQQNSSRSSLMPTEPGAPTGLSAVPGDGEAIISFTPGSDGGSPITNYEYWITDASGSMFEPFSPPQSSSPVTITGLPNGTTLSIRLRAVNSIGVSSQSDIVTVTPATVPDAPTAVSATAGSGSASVSFTAPANNGGSTITGYTVTSSPGGFTASGSSSPITVNGLTNGTAYTFTVVATNSVGNSVSSLASSAVTPTAPTDAIAGSLTTSLASYNAAANGNWVKITSAEYTSLKANVTGTTRAGISDAYLALVNGSGLSVTDQSAIVANTATANTPAIPANNYVYACAIQYGKNVQATDMRIFTNTNSTSYTGFNQLGGVLPGTTTGGGGFDLNCYVLKGVSTTNGATSGLLAVFSGQTASSIPPLGFYQNFSVTNSMRYLLFTPGATGGLPNSSSVISGNLSGYGAFCIQALTTATKQWA